MKRWYVKIASTTSVCSLLQMDAKMKMAVVKSDDDKNIIVMFNDFFDFSKAKNGIVTQAKAVWQHGKYKKNCTVTFK